MTKMGFLAVALVAGGLISLAFRRLEARRVEREFRERMKRLLNKNLDPWSR